MDDFFRQEVYEANLIKVSKPRIDGGDSHEQKASEWHSKQPDPDRHAAELPVPTARPHLNT